MMMQIYRIKRGLVREIIEDFPEMKAFLQSIPICHVNRDIKVSIKVLERIHLFIQINPILSKVWQLCNLRREHVCKFIANQHNLFRCQ